MSEGNAQLEQQTTSGCQHFGHAEGEWFYGCCACSGLPGGCDNCREPEQQGEHRA